MGLFDYLQFLTGSPYEVPDYGQAGPPEINSQGLFRFPGSPGFEAQVPPPAWYQSPAPGIMGPTNRGIMQGSLGPASMLPWDRIGAGAESALDSVAGYLPPPPVNFNSLYAPEGMSMQPAPAYDPSQVSPGIGPGPPPPPTPEALGAAQAFLPPQMEGPPAPVRFSDQIASLTQPGADFAPMPESIMPPPPLSPFQEWEQGYDADTQELLAQMQKENRNNMFIGMGSALMANTLNPAQGLAEAAGVAARSPGKSALKAYEMERESGKLDYLTKMSQIRKAMRGETPSVAQQKYDTQMQTVAAMAAAGEMEEAEKLFRQIHDMGPEERFFTDPMGGIGVYDKDTGTVRVDDGPPISLGAYNQRRSQEQISKAGIEAGAKAVLPAKKSEEARAKVREMFGDVGPVAEAFLVEKFGKVASLSPEEAETAVTEYLNGAYQRARERMIESGRPEAVAALDDLMETNPEEFWKLLAELESQEQ